MNAVDDESWRDWLAAREASPRAAQIALQRVFRDNDAKSQHAVGLGYGERLRWFGPIDTAGKRLLERARNVVPDQKTQAPMHVQHGIGDRQAVFPFFA